MRLYLVTFGIVCVFSSFNQLWARTYYASPRGQGNGSSPERPFVIARFWNRAQPGDTLVLLDGTYLGAESMVTPPKGLRGSKGLPITVRAMNDGKTAIDGQNINCPIALNYNDWFVIEGLNAHSSKSTVVSVSHSNYCVIRRVCGWDASDGNTYIFAAHYGQHNVFEDCAGWGIARKVFSCSQGGNYTTFRRCFGCWQGCHAVGPKMTFTLFYNSHHITAENCIATWDGKLMRKEYTVMGYNGKPFTKWGNGSGKVQRYTNFGVDQPHGCFGEDGNDRGPTKGPFMYGCIAYRLNKQMVANVPALFTISCEQPHDGWFENCAAIVEQGAEKIRPFNIVNVDGYNLTAVGGLDPIISKSNITNILRATDDQARVAWGKMLQRRPPEKGAHIYYRYENGKLTDKPLWPWPMNERIKELTGIDVTATIFGLGETTTQANR